MELHERIILRLSCRQIEESSAPSGLAAQFAEIDSSDNDVVAASRRHTHLDSEARTGGGVVGETDNRLGGLPEAQFSGVEPVVALGIVSAHINASAVAVKRFDISQLEHISTADPPVGIRRHAVREAFAERQR